MSPTFIFISFATIGIVFVLVGLPLKQGKIPPNIWYGFRTRKTLSDPDIWYTVNRVTGADMVVGGVILTVVSMMLFILGSLVSTQVSIAALLIVTLGMVAWMAVHGFSILKQL